MKEVHVILPRIGASVSRMDIVLIEIGKKKADPRGRRRSKTWNFEISVDPGLSASF